MVSNIGIIILAAGSSKRFAADKRLAKMKNGLSLLENTLNQIPDCFTNRLLVLRSGDEEFAKLFSPKWDIFIAEDSAQGMGHSLAGAMNTIMNSTTNWQGALIGLGDMPFIKPDTYSDIQQALTEHEIVTPVIQEQQGNPVGFQAKYFSEIARLSGDEGAKKIITKYQTQCFRYESSDEGIFKDIDTPDALSKSDD